MNKEKLYNKIMNVISTVLKNALNETYIEHQYECLNEASSWIDGMKKNNVPTIVSSKEHMILCEGIDYEPADDERGGIIVFSTDVNAIQLSKNKIVNWIKQKVTTLSNRFKTTSMIDNIADKHNLIGWTVGHYLDGRYKAKNGQMFGENSLSLEIIGVKSDKLISIAEDICRDFNQESVLLKDNNNGRILFVNPD